VPDKSGTDDDVSARSPSVDERARPQSGDLPVGPQRGDGSARPETAGPRDSRLRDVVRVVAIMATIAAVGGGLIWAGDRWGHANDSGNPNGAGQDYAGLLAKLPASLRDTCHSEAPGSSDSTARAQCATGEFALWRSKAALHEELGVYGTTSADCTSAPPAGERRSAGLPAGHTGSVVCEVLNADQPATNQRYCVEWGVDDLLLTGSFYSTEGGGPASYRDTYDEAMDALGQLPA